MTTPRRRQREQADRRRLIVTTARAMAEADGWDKVTTRRLAEAIEYSQPVLYGHFPDGKPQIMTAVAIDGFTEITAVLTAYSPRVGARTRLRTVAEAYLDFAAQNPAVYEAMFARPIAERFPGEQPTAELKAAFMALETALPDSVPTRDKETMTEVLWSSLHGLASLAQGQRLRPAERERRITLLVELFVSG